MLENLFIVTPFAKYSSNMYWYSKKGPIPETKVYITRFIRGVNYIYIYICIPSILRAQGNLMVPRFYLVKINDCGVQKRLRKG
jgi:hypothetical protein